MTTWSEDCVCHSSCQCCCVCDANPENVELDAAMQAANAITNDKDQR